MYTSEISFSVLQRVIQFFWGIKNFSGRDFELIREWEPVSISLCFSLDRHGKYIWIRLQEFTLTFSTNWAPGTQSPVEESYFPTFAFESPWVFAVWGSVRINHWMLKGRNKKIVLSSLAASLGWYLICILFHLGFVSDTNIWYLKNVCQNWEIRKESKSDPEKEASQELIKSKP